MACFCPTPRDVQLFSSKSLSHYTFSSEGCTGISFVSKNLKQGVQDSFPSIFFKIMSDFLPTHPKDLPKFYKHVKPSRKSMD